MEPPVLETERLVLRGFGPADFEAYAAMFGDPEVARHVGDGTPLDRTGAWRSLAMVVGHWRLAGCGLWAVAERGGSGEAVGRVGLLRPEGWPGLELAWAIARPRQGRGYATEAAARAMAWAFDEFGADRLVSMVRPENAPSIRVAEKLGMARDGEIGMLGAPALLFARRRPG